MDYIARKLEVNGIVQGVGFRPFVYQLADQYHLKGEVANTSSGVTISIEGTRAHISQFIKDLSEKSPPLSQIIEIIEKNQPLNRHTAFKIVKSRGQTAMSTLISPDVSICDDCLKEVLDPNDRRYQYPFINCTNCGPRYTIIDDIPYDRPKTSMKHFKMCPECQAEYDDPLNRRFHAQPNACAVCGPHVTLYGRDRERIDTEDPIHHSADLLKKGKILAIKGLGGYHLAADALNPNAVIRLRQRKRREEKPFAVMSFDMETIKKYSNVTTDEEALLTSHQRPIVLLRKKNSNNDDGPVREVSPRNQYFGVMLPYTPLHYLLLNHGFTALVMTSGNLSEEPISIDNDDAFDRLSEIADYFLVHNRDIYLRSDDSIVRRTAGEVRFMRRSRGYVPVPVFLKNKIPPILSCGAELKNTVCLTKDKQAFISQHIGDLENPSTLDFFEMTILHMKRILAVDPEIIACDLHPDYLSTRYAMCQDIQKIQVQHHHAHIVSCMAENKIDGPVIGLSFDGTGYGEDKSFWGGEVLIADLKNYTRAAHMSYVPMPGGEAAIREPWRMAVSYLVDAFGNEIPDTGVLGLKDIESRKIDIIKEMILKKINSPDTSSLGRLFDGVAALCGIRNKVAYEGQAAMELEMSAGEITNEGYDYEWSSGEVLKIKPGPIIKGVVKDIKGNIHPSIISSRFHTTLIRLFTEMCSVIHKEKDLDRVVMSGGVFQNSLLLTGMVKALEEKQFKVYTHKLVPFNDGGISLGQAVVAAAVLKNGL